jgi:hypothetical protein
MFGTLIKKKKKKKKKIKICDILQIPTPIKALCSTGM